MVDRTLLNYVEQVYTLESEHYTLAQMIDRLKQEYVLKKNRLQAEQLKGNNEYIVAVNSQYEGKEKVSVVLGVILIVFSVFALLYGIAVHGGYSFISNIFSFICVGVMLIIGIALYKSGKRMRDTRIEHAYNKKKEADERAQSQLNDIKKRNNEIRTACAKLDETIKELERMLSEKNNALNYMYEYDIIHRSYRNFYGISKIYHLLDTGICDSLTGVNGAYSQMRTDQIIDNQKISIELQQNILATNLLMYNAMQRTNDLLVTMNQQINLHNANNIQLLQDIRNNVEISNFLIQSGNDDRKALAASAEYLAYAEKQKRLAAGHWY